MKFATIVLSFLMLVLSLTPCSDGYNSEDEHLDETTENHNHQNDSDDSCPITCICNCCGMNIAYEPIKTINFKLTTKICTSIISTYQSNYIFDFHSKIWQPPQLIS